MASFRGLLLALHKTLLDQERKFYEDRHGKVANPGVMLGIVMGNPDFAWLRQISSVIVGIDELLESKEPASEQKYKNIIIYVKQLLVPKEGGDVFAKKYFNAIRNNSEASLIHSQIQGLIQKLE